MSLGWERLLFQPRHFEEWCQGCLNGPLGFRGQLLESFPTKGTGLEAFPVRLLDKPFPTMPTLDNWSYTHFAQFTSPYS